ncbi:MAG: SDR family NAD(P)-dependent oxidoreductase [Myxococcota bacterium]
MASHVWKNKTALVTGVGPGTGKALVERFVEGGYRVGMIARNEERLAAIAKAHGDAVLALPCDVTDTDALAGALAAAKDAFGVPSVVIHNAVGGAFGDFTEIDPETLRQNFEVNTMALLELARRVTDDMVANGGGALITTGNTSAYRGKANFAGFAPSKAAQRILMESIARSHGPKGIHACFVAIDAVIDLEWTRARFADAPDDFFCKPADIAGEVFHVAHQPRSAWTSDLMIRPFGETW